MTTEKKVFTFFQNPFYDDLFGVFDVVVPSKRVSYKRSSDGAITAVVVPRGAQEFEQFIKESFVQDKNPMWPRKGRLLVAMEISLVPHEYNCKDIDNIAKSILDALKGLAFEDDIQVDSIHFRKSSSDRSGFMIGIKQLSTDDPGWYFPPLYAEQPFEEEQTYRFIARRKFDQTRDASKASS